ncbi:MAG: apolipoprotein N-acyltransferase [Lentisphaeria bacterium]|nr:apolipoprotein N-acyltransferase [Lentisphaeria bacterium]
MAGWRYPLLTAGGCVGSGLLLSAAFPPLGWGGAVWVALVPVLSVPVPATIRGRLVAGYLLGYTHWASGLLWLNEVGFGAGYLLALYCALYPMAWYVGMAAVRDALAGGRRGVTPGGCCDVVRGWRHPLLVLAGACFWVALEWLRGWFLTGFPWNELAVSQWRQTGLLCLAAFAGTAGIGALIVATNVALALTLRRWLGEGGRRGISWGLLTVAVLMLCVPWAVWRVPRVRYSEASLRVLCVQGNIPQCRFWTEEQFQEALDTYTGLTRLTAPVAKPDLVVWPESAVPAPLGYPPLKEALEALMAEVRTPLLIGAIDTRPDPAATGLEPSQEGTLDYNSAILLGADGKVVDRYDKIHRVPFGEYVPFGRHLPWLVDLIGMGRGLTAGSEFTVMPLGKGIEAGTNICFEDVFADISRSFVLRGANLLLTLTNDAWYAESAGSRQHLIHAVMRAAELRRPLLRSGNNSDTCMIWPDGTVTGRLVDAQTGNPFVRGTNVYTIPVPDAPPLTLYARWGNWFGRANAVAACAILAWVLRRAYRDRMRRREAVADA